ncbi:MAG TPA: hypothetical protein VLK84_29280 [Longimicrobium sp.]|nr:hypothetical protein [Longimicrobium sp.]
MTGSNPPARLVAIALLLLAGGCGGAGPDAQVPEVEPSPSATSAPSSGSADTGASAAVARGPEAVIEAPQAAAEPENPIWTPVLPRLRSEVRIPLRLPEVLGWEDEPPDSAFAIVERADPAGYVLMIGLASDCDGGNWCRYGSVSGERIAGAEDAPGGTPVPLADGITGHFVDATCGAVCSDAKLWWEEDGVRYAVGVKAARVETLVPIARSALGPR